MFSFALEHRAPESPGVSNMKQRWYSCSSTFLGWAWLLLLKGWRNSRANFQKGFFSSHSSAQPQTTGGCIQYSHLENVLKTGGSPCNYLSSPKDSFCCLLHASIGLQLALGCALREAVCSGCWEMLGISPGPHLYRHSHAHSLQLLRQQTAGVKYATWRGISNWAIC